MTGVAGFDPSDYPGDDVCDWLWANTNLKWCGYYLGPTQSHGGVTWMGRRPGLAAAGWGIAPLYVGQQVIEPGSLNASTATGVQDGQQAVSYLSAEGFNLGSCVYLDLENGPPFPSNLQDYVAAWCDAVAAGGYLPGVYCSHLLAVDVHTLRPAARIWAFNVATTRPHPVPSPFPDPTPSGCGYIGATAWQLGQECMISVPPANLSSLDVDLSSSIVADPGAPAPAV